ncbi:hypothetical protein C9374_003572 [Naegleria lovaniensis]|uniref:Uncharacterized protein n=1 Tax=Naegleria lovaniensis TaxID=51637 RepID=A0AA88H3E7_NAELO|nr:uncharacterized protein C9374_003572 [Naegleria lovaniensis]KAG2393808.1 hypothetical protein C9374_003572 [Naegleria lovaniensis]
MTTTFNPSVLVVWGLSPLITRHDEIQNKDDQQSLIRYLLATNTTNTTLSSSSIPNPYLQYVSIIPIALMGIFGFLICSLSLLSVVVYCAKEYRKRNRRESSMNADPHHSSNFTSLSKNLVTPAAVMEEDEENRMDYGNSAELYTRRPQRLNRDYDSDEEQAR